MANIFTRKISRNIGTSPTDVGSYTVGASTTAIVIGLSLCNVSAAAITVNASLYDGANEYFVVYTAPLAPGQSVVVGGGEQKLAMITGDRIRVTSSAASSVDAVLSIMEIT